MPDRVAPHCVVVGIDGMSPSVRRWSYSRNRRMPLENEDFGTYLRCPISDRMVSGDGWAVVFVSDSRRGHSNECSATI